MLRHYLLHQVDHDHYSCEGRLAYRNSSNTRTYCLLRTRAYQCEPVTYQRVRLSGSQRVILELRLPIARPLCPRRRIRYADYRHPMVCREILPHGWGTLQAAVNFRVTLAYNKD